jgi:hypothetical protein
MRGRSTACANGMHTASMVTGITLLVWLSIHHMTTECVCVANHTCIIVCFLSVKRVQMDKHLSVKRCGVVI